MEDLVFKNKPIDYDCAITVKIQAYAQMNVCFARMPEPEIANEVYDLLNYPQILMYEDEYTLDVVTNKSCISRLERERNIYNLDIPPVYDAIRIARELCDNLTNKFNFSVRLIIEGNNNIKFIKPKIPKN